MKELHNAKINKNLNEYDKIMSSYFDEKKN